ncbi:hypothetical protein PF003_g958 [Phytophthora fragariae]|nr:hypothetical protein PF003_g958 [Phytophthora fragariae]
MDRFGYLLVPPGTKPKKQSNCPELPVIRCTTTVDTFSESEDETKTGDEDILAVPEPSDAFGTGDDEEKSPGRPEEEMKEEMMREVPRWIRDNVLVTLQKIGGVKVVAPIPKCYDT